MSDKIKGFEYITVEGDRWDSISAKFYSGNSNLYEEIIKANNLEQPVSPILESGIKLFIPDIEEDNIIKSEELPPWKA